MKSLVAGCCLLTLFSPIHLAAQQAQRSAPTPLDVAVRADIARAGVAAGLATYERVVTPGKPEDRVALHEIARAALREAVASARPAARFPIVRALAEDGDPVAMEKLASAEVRDAADPGQLASAGDAAAVKLLLADLNSPVPAIKRRAIVALAASRSTRAVDPFIAALNDEDAQVRAAAATGLGQLGDKRAITPLKALLTDQFMVHFEAAAALLALGDRSGAAWLSSLEGSDHDAIRLSVAQVTKSEPTGTWLANVSRLLASSDSDVKRQAAELLAPHDPQAARDALLPLLGDDNIVLRELAANTYAEIETDLSLLRRFFKDARGEARVKAAIRLLALTR